MDGIDAKPGIAPWRRLATTIALALVPLVGERIPLPGLDRDSALFSHDKSVATSLFALGVAPLLSGYLAVELAALLVPRWRKLRHDNPGRRKLQRAALVLALVLAAFQAFGVAMMLSSPELVGAGVEVSRPLVLVSLIGATAVLALAARQIDTLGLVSGVVLLYIASEGSRLPGYFEKVELPSEPSRLVMVIALYALPPFAAWATLRGSLESAKHEPLWLSAPLSSLQPVTSVPALLALPASLSAFQLPLADDVAKWLGGSHGFELVLGFGVLATLLLALLLQRPKVVLGLLRQLGRGNQAAPIEPGQLRHAFAKALWPTVLLVMTALIADQLAWANGLPALASRSTLLVALLLDGFDALRLHRALPGLVCVAEERRPYAVPELAKAAERAGLTLRATGFGQASLLRVFGPYAAIGLWTHADDAPKVRALLREQLESPRPEVAPSEVDEEERMKPSRATDDSAGSLSPGPWGNGAYGWLQAAAFLMVAALAIASYTPGSGLLALATRLDTVQAELEVVAVNDEHDPLAPIDDAALPAGVAKFSELIRDPNGQRRSVVYARLVLQGTESLDQALQRLRPWLDTLTLPKNARLAWQPQPLEPEGNVPPYDPAHDPEPAPEAFRSYLVQGAPIFSTPDVGSVELTTSTDGFASTTLRLTRPAADRLRRATHHSDGRRLAIIVDQMVVSAPVVRGEITNGILQISPGGLEPDETSQRARALLRKLTTTPAK